MRRDLQRAWLDRSGWPAPTRQRGCSSCSG
ncbi:MAG: DUF4224 domain-containing protein [Chloroflexi bacterium]|nr:DUF4224 domain-containing protein [Chloroflexota bacterium]